jgi:hypothetical protein
MPPTVASTQRASSERSSPGSPVDSSSSVRRYFSHAISDGAALPHGVRMAMSGRIKVGLWLPFIAEQTVDGRSFTWRARVGRGPLTPLRVTDRYADAAGSTEGRLLGRLTLFHAHDTNTARSAATRTAIESVVFAPPRVPPDLGVTWQERERHRRPLRPPARATRGSPGHRRTRRDPNRQRPALGKRRREDLPAHPLRRRDPRRTPLRRPPASQHPQRRLVVRHPALRAVLPCQDLGRLGPSLLWRTRSRGRGCSRSWPAATWSKGCRVATHFPALLGPALAASVVTARVFGRAGVRDLLARMARWRMPVRWWAATLSPLAFLGVALAVARAGGTLPRGSASAATAACPRSASSPSP